jgi:hypothetical protein
MPRSPAPTVSRRPRPTRRVAGTAAAEVLEDRVLPAITILVDYSLDTVGFFNNPKAREAIESVAAELGSRLTHHIGELLPGYYKTLKPSTLSYDYVYSSAPADTLRLFAGGTAVNGPDTSILAQCGSIDSLSTRHFDFTREYAPFTTTMAVGTIWNWDFDGTNTAPDAYDFKAVMRHELMHGLGIGQSDTWYQYVTFDGTNNVFTGPTARAVEGGRNPQTTPAGFDGAAHFNQGEYSLMQPFYSDIRRPTALDWAALNDIGWEVSMPGKYADVFTRANDGTWYAAVSAKGLSKPIEFGKWDESRGWQDVTQGDLNGDGLTDVVGRTSNGAWYAGINGSNGFSNKFYGSWLENDPRNGWRMWVDVQFGDFNGDGLLDVAGRNYQGYWYVGLNNGSRFVTNLWSKIPWTEVVNPNTGKSLLWQDVNTGDFNGDGRTDIAARSVDGDWYVALNAGVSYGFRTLRWAGWSPTAGWRDVRVADLDGNGATDLIGRASDGGWYVALSFADHAAPALPWARWNEAAGWRGVEIGDFSGDGRADILARTAGGAWYLAQNVGGMSFRTALYGQWSEAAGWQTVLTGDFDSNSLIDVLAQSRDGRWWLGVNNGSKLTFKPYGKWTSALGWQDFGVTKALFPASAGPGAPGASAVNGSGNGGGLSFHPETGSAKTGSAKTAAAKTVAATSIAPALKLTVQTPRQTTSAAQGIAPVGPALSKLAAPGAATKADDGGNPATAPAAFPSPDAHDLFWSLADRDEGLAAGLLSAV